mgnify:CR=1 FL=1
MAGVEQTWTSRCCDPGEHPGCPLLGRSEKIGSALGSKRYRRSRTGHGDLPHRDRKSALPGTTATAHPGRGRTREAKSQTPPTLPRAM